jgi:hypothetical protein
LGSFNLQDGKQPNGHLLLRAKPVHLVYKLLQQWGSACGNDTQKADSPGWVRHLQE